MCLTCFFVFFSVNVNANVPAIRINTDETNADSSKLTQSHGGSANNSTNSPRRGNCNSYGNRTKKPKTIRRREEAEEEEEGKGKEEWEEEEGKRERERIRQLLSHNMCCGQMVLNYALRLFTSLM